MAATATATAKNETPRQDLRRPTRMHEFQVIATQAVTNQTPPTAMVIAKAIAEPARAAFDLPSPLQRRPGGGSARRVARMDASQFGVSPWMDCRQTPQPGRVPPGPTAREARKRGGLSFGYFSLAKQRKVTRPPKEDETLWLLIRPGAKEPRSKWLPALAGMTTMKGTADTLPELPSGERRQRRRPDAAFPRAPAPHLNPLPGGERR